MVFARCSFVMRAPFPFLCIKLGLLLTHFALSTEKAFTGAVPDVHELAMCGAGETDDERPDAHILVVCVQKHQVSVSNRSALDRIITHGMCWTQLGAGFIDWHRSLFIFAAMAVFWKHLQLQMCLCDAHDRVDHALHHKLFATAPRTTNKSNAVKLLPI